MWSSRSAIRRTRRTWVTELINASVSKTMQANAKIGPMEPNTCVHMIPATTNAAAQANTIRTIRKTLADTGRQLVGMGRERA